MMIWKDIGFSLIIFVAGLKGIPEMYYEAAIVDGCTPFGAFRKVGRRMHRVLDLVVFVVVVAACFVPSVDAATRLVMALIAVVFAAVIFRTDYTPPVPRAERHQPGDGRADDLGRQAGRVAGTLAARARDSWRRRG